eukprot:TRINITY_DN632_c0_g1_i1.p2 TRINITY_DN632_c0_g1~~TRINITY_DN632_c0_g1_i1.p2  ORF type:complete len:104 (-),score=21.10 TRINITY_DN632_c0_g1_i1:68-379(-)
MAKHTIPIMKAKKSGSVVNLGSISSFIAQPSFTPYNTSKGAIVQLTRCMAMDYGEASHGSESMPCVQRMGTTQDVANAVLFLASEESSFITGQTLTVKNNKKQ